MTAVAILLIGARALDWLIFRDLRLQEAFPATVIGTCLGVIAIAAMWTTLGSNSLWIRLLALVLTAAGSGVFLKWVSAYWVRRIGPMNLWGNHIVWIANEMGSSWLVWCALATCFLAASLVIFRARGYGLTTGIRKRY
jgi:hypothetical protein